MDFKKCGQANLLNGVYARTNLAGMREDSVYEGLEIVILSLGAVCDNFVT